MTKRWLKAKEFTQGIKQIDSSGCPKDFQLVWREFVLTWESFTEAGLDLGKGLPPGQLKAWESLKHVALSYDVWPDKLSF